MNDLVASFGNVAGLQQLPEWLTSYVYSEGIMGWLSDVTEANNGIEETLTHVEVVSNTSTVSLRVIGGDEKGTQCLGI
jgi:hypothetical protein